MVFFLFVIHNKTKEYTDNNDATLNSPTFSTLGLGRYYLLLQSSSSSSPPLLLFLYISGCFVFTCIYIYISSNGVVSIVLFTACAREASNSSSLTFFLNLPFSLYRIDTYILTCFASHFLHFPFL